MSPKKEYTGKERREGDAFMLGRMAEASEKTSEDISNIYTELTRQGKKIARLEVKAGVFGIIGGGLVALPVIGWEFIKSAIAKGGAG